ncbi:hypothetical protein BVJ53_09540 [Lacticaseibacillus chiayiensis]|uniref:Fluoride-specific ion channel FluC n=1 Tax=Lacticaseibacillus chiayiensis TaxID=2100821 RepID=A0A4Q1TQ69_9LACO|nr:CrcB family protein [Lacticaseibacillus chiayiensis]QVI34249.1 CrcB family protein [Lacticaseibacillus chiayiensis]RXT20824.1 hypothetical protein BVJ53_09540 [Lacticaseibacillus chiayiensis]RXT57961.1 hypothetical protein CHT97_09240 [Lacticaseibacillus chiayiensis]UYN56027.1 CrcB family protein [Lacticaseibacillus chiayiensis]
MMQREQVRVGWLVGIFVGGFFGGILRYWISTLTTNQATMMGTTIVNLLGSFLLALTTYGWNMKFDLPEWLLLAIGTGLIGGFTTFSTLMLDFVSLVRTNVFAAILMLSVNLLGGMLAVVAGVLVAKFTVGKDRGAL